MLTLWRTTHALPTFADQLHRLVNDVAQSGPAFSATGLVPPADVLETADDYRVAVDLPGIDAASIRLEVVRDTLSISAERRFTPPASGEELLRSERAFGTSTRSFALPVAVDAAAVEARYEQGVLSVRLPKRAEAKPRTIPVKVG